MNEGVVCGGLVRRRAEGGSMDGCGHSVGLPVEIKGMPPAGDGDVEVYEVPHTSRMNLMDR